MSTIQYTSHTSHSNTATHSNSLYDSEGNTSYSAPDISSVPGVETPTVEMTMETFKLPTVNQNIELPNGTPVTSIIPTLSIPTSTPISNINNKIHQPSVTEKID